MTGGEIVTMFLVLVWLGGITACPDKAMGFWNRVAWPGRLGEALHKWALQKMDERDNP